MATVAIYAGTYDPFTKGHLSVLRGGLKAFDHVIVGVGHNTSKKVLFSEPERRNIVQEYIDDLHPKDSSRVSVEIFDGLLIEFCKSVYSRPLKTEAHLPESVTILRGLRAVSDFEAETAIADANRRLDQRFATLFVPTEAEFAYVSSSIVKEIALHAGPVDPYVISSVAERLKVKLTQ